MPAGSKKYDLEDRTFEFAKRVRAFVRALNKCLGNLEDGKQLIRCQALLELIISKPTKLLVKKIFLCVQKYAGKRPRKASTG